MTTTGKVFLSCAFGSGIGALVALSLWQPIWWLGMLVGGLVGYLSYEFKAVIAAIPMAWRVATTQAQRITWAKTWETITLIIAFLTTAVTMMTPPILVTWFAFAVHNDYQGLAAVGMLGIMFSTVGSGVFAGTQILEKRMGLGRFILRYNILTAYAYILAQLLLWAARVVMRIPIAIGVAAIVGGKFFWNLFIEVHSDIRLLCGLDAALGAAVGYYFGNALIGALVGGVFGVVNYKVISEWWLRLVPSR